MMRSRAINKYVLSCIVLFSAVFCLNNVSYANVSAGDFFTSAIQSDGSLWAWGINPYGQLGDNSTAGQTMPEHIGASSWSQVSAGGNQTLG
ncbi:MAG: hypothetical protein HQK97_09850, partial [Nitrospirae bacterium]|nr:hypothetical protein [Nitrospirota bacterium]